MMIELPMEKSTWKVISIDNGTNTITVDGKEYRIKTEESQPARDPYLVPGQPCEIYEERREYTRLAYFSSYNGEQKMFVYFRDLIGKETEEFEFKDYRPIGTVWDFLPDWVELIAMDEGGKWWVYEKEPVKNSYAWTSRHGDRVRSLPNYHNFPQISDWADSLHRRPSWARSVL